MAFLTMNVRRGSIYAALGVMVRVCVSRASTRVVTSCMNVRPRCDLGVSVRAARTPTISP
jgi:hypothetical protein